jgi:hypothetical protein
MKTFNKLIWSPWRPLPLMEDGLSIGGIRRRHTHATISPYVPVVDNRARTPLFIVGTWSEQQAIHMLSESTAFCVFGCFCAEKILSGQKQQKAKVF